MVDMGAGLAVFRLAGPQVLTDGMERIAAAIADSADRGIRGLVVDIRDIEGLAPPGVGARHEFARMSAEAARGRLRVAMVVRPEFIDPDRFAIVAARNFGLVANVFETQDDALEWLRAELA